MRAAGDELPRPGDVRFQGRVVIASEYQGRSTQTHPSGIFILLNPVSPWYTVCEAWWDGVLGPWKLGTDTSVAFETIDEALFDYRRWVKNS